MANNPGDPEAASMEVSETKLVNFAEKTKFDVTSEFSFPPLDPSGQVYSTLVKNGATLVFPRDVSSIQNPDGTWNGTLPAYRFLKDGVVYSSFAELPGASGADSLKITKGLTQYTSGDVNQALIAHSSDTQKVQVFQLDPNQLLTVSSGFKVLMKRPFSH